MSTGLWEHGSYRYATMFYGPNRVCLVALEGSKFVSFDQIH